MYIINLASLKRMTLAGSITLLILLCFIGYTCSESARVFGYISFGFFGGFMAAFALCWTAITMHAKKIKPSEAPKL